MWKRVLLWVVIGGAAAFLLIQLVPYGREHANPPVTNEIQWDSERTRELAKAACFDCHSNETHWPWYSNVAPFSWLLTRDVTMAREKMNFSEWTTDLQALTAAAMVQSKLMPLSRYVMLNPKADLSDDERQELAQGFQAIGGE